jgi:hypothetical protein
MQGKVIVMSIVTILRSTLCKEDLPMPKSSLMVSSELEDWTGGRFMLKQKTWCLALTLPMADFEIYNPEGPSPFPPIGSVSKSPLSFFQPNWSIRLGQ